MYETGNGGNLICCFTPTVSSWVSVGTDSYLTTLFLDKSPIGSWLYLVPILLASKWRLAFLKSAEERKKSSKEGREGLSCDCLHTKRTCYQPSYRAWIEGARGRSTVPIQGRILCWRMSKIVLSLICALVFSCLVSLNKQPDFYYRKIQLFFNRCMQDRNRKC